MLLLLLLHHLRRQHRPRHLSLPPLSLLLLHLLVLVRP